QFWIELNKENCVNLHYALSTKERRLKLSINYSNNYKNKNRQKIIDYKKEYYKSNKDTLFKNIKKYHNENKDELNQKRNAIIFCDCGFSYTKQNKARHFKSKKHLNSLEHII